MLSQPVLCQPIEKSSDTNKLLLRQWMRRRLPALLLGPALLSAGCNALPGRPDAALRTSRSPQLATNYSLSDQESIDGEGVVGPNSQALASTGKSTTKSDVVTVAYQAPVDLSPSACSSCGGDCGGNCGGGTDGGTDCNTNCGSCGICVGLNPTQPNAQEYIFDGGDQVPGVLVLKDWTAAGVDPSDTVIYYETLGGQVCVKASNRVPIYAPRFGAVRQVSGLVLAQRAVGTERFLVPVHPAGMQENAGAGNVTQPLAAHGEQQVNLLDAFQENQGGVPIAQVLPPLRMSDSLKPWEDLNFFSTGVMLDEEIPVLGRILANARTWYTPESVQVEVQGEVAALVVDAKRAQDVHVYEMPDKCAMRICKAASHTVANPGDIVRFTIRFDNVGPKPLGNAVVMDSLVARLEYIEGSQQCSIASDFSTTPNDVGSQVLRWEIQEPIEKGEGGVISFDCRVR